MIAFSSAVSSLSRDWEKYLNNPFVFINFLDDDVFLHLMSDGLNFSVMRISGRTILNISAVYIASLSAL